MVASDLSEESSYALQWAIGTILRDGDELLFVTVLETEEKREHTLSRLVGDGADAVEVNSGRR